MKKNLALLLAVVLVMTSMFALGTVAGAETKSTAPSQEIAYFNVSIKTNVSLLFAVPADGYTVNADGTVSNLQLLVWKNGASTGVFNKNDAIANGSVLDAQGVTIINGKPHIIFTYSGLSAAEMCETVYARLIYHNAVTDQEFRSYSEIYDYSIAEFVNGYLNSENPLHNQKELVSAMMDYGAFAAIYNNKINKTSYTAYDAKTVKALKQVTVNAVLGGKIVATSKQFVVADKEVTLDTPYVDGASLKSWSDNATDGKITVDSGADEVVVTATYENKILGSYDIEDSSVGAYISSNYSGNPTSGASGTVVGTLKIGVGNPNISNNFNADANGSTYKYSKYLVVEENGNKYVKVSHNGASQENLVHLAPTSGSKVSNMTGVGDTVGFTFSIDIKADANGKFPPTSFHIDRLGNATSHTSGGNGYLFSLYADGSVKLNTSTAVEYNGIKTLTIIGAGEASSTQFQTVSVYVDFAEGLIYGYLNGVLKAVGALHSNFKPASTYLASNDNYKNTRFSICMYGNSVWSESTAKGYKVNLNGVETPLFADGKWNHDAIEAYVDANNYFYYDNVIVTYGNTASK